VLPGFRLERVRRQVGAPVFPILARDTARTAPFAAATTVKNAPKKTLYQFRGSESEVCPQKAAAVPVPAVPAVPAVQNPQNPWSVPTVSRYRDRPGPAKTVVCPCHATVHAGTDHGFSSLRRIALPQVLPSRVAGHPRLDCTHCDTDSLVTLICELVQLTPIYHPPGFCAPLPKGQSPS
jgi:hypothetical protein